MWQEADLIYSKQAKVLFTHVSRTGGAAMSNCLRAALPDCQRLGSQHAPLAAARPLLGERFDEAFKFAFVRNPWERFVSWFALLGRAKLAPSADPSVLRDPESKHWKGFDAFLEKWSVQTMLIDGVSQPEMSQWAQLADGEGRLLADELGRFETLVADADRLFAKAGVPARPLPKINSSTHGDYRLYYTPFGRALVEQVFPEDIALLGYQFEAVTAGLATPILCAEDPLSRPKSQAGDTTRSPARL